jgi:hypothetical protein
MVILIFTTVTTSNFNCSFEFGGRSANQAAVRRIMVEKR